MAIYSCNVHISNSYSTPFSFRLPLLSSPSNPPSGSNPIHSTNSSQLLFFHKCFPLFSPLPSTVLSLNSGKNASQSGKSGERTRVRRIRSTSGVGEADRAREYS
jgi:hypothetical protein